MRSFFEISGTKVKPGQALTVDIPMGLLSNHTPMTLPVHVIHGRREGPTVFVSAAIHGDEILGVEIIRRIIQMKSVQRPRGTLLFVPIVNAYGFISHSRYLPDRRDLNRSFPGSANGSLASRLANVFMQEIVNRSDYGIDLHTAGMHRCNLPQIRANLGNEVVKKMADAFAAPVTLDTNLRDGSLRQVAQEAGVHTLLFEAGEALRFDESSIRFGVKGILRVLQHVGITPRKKNMTRKYRPVISKSSHWLRSPAGGILRMSKGLGDGVLKDELLGVISSPFGDRETEIRSKSDGIIIGRTKLPVLNEGDAVFHIAKVFDPEKAEGRVETMEQELVADPIFDEEII